MDVHEVYKQMYTSGKFTGEVLLRERRTGRHPWVCFYCPGSCRHHRSGGLYVRLLGESGGGSTVGPRVVISDIYSNWFFHPLPLTQPEGAYFVAFVALARALGDDSGDNSNLPFHAEDVPEFLLAIVSFAQSQFIHTVSLGSLDGRFVARWDNLE